MDLGFTNFCCEFYTKQAWDGDVTTCDLYYHEQDGFDFINPLVSKIANDPNYNEEYSFDKGGGTNTAAWAWTKNDQEMDVNGNIVYRNNGEYSGATTVAASVMALAAGATLSLI